jgi:hypothetical protein
MSWFETRELDCPRCARSFPAATAETINVTRMPTARDRILDGSFHRVECSHCHAIIEVDRAFLYSDLRREQFIHVFPLSHFGAWPHWEEVAGQTFWSAFDPAPPAMHEVARRFAVRAVFGLDALADKLRIWDAGLDDSLVELLKLELAASDPTLRSRRDLLLDVVGVDPGARTIEVAARSAHAGWPEERYSIRQSRYDELRAARLDLEEKFPLLFFRPFVSFRRLARRNPEVQ